MAAIVFPPKLDYARRKETRAFRSMGKNDGDGIMRGEERKEGECERHGGGGRDVSETTSGGDAACEKRSRFDYSAYIHVYVLSSYLTQFFLAYFLASTPRS